MPVFHLFEGTVDSKPTFCSCLTGNTVFARVMIENPRDKTLAGKPQEVSLDRGSNFNTLLMRMIEQVDDEDVRYVRQHVLFIFFLADRNMTKSM